MENTDRFAERLLTERETAVVPGRFFDAPFHFRIGFGGETERCEAASLLSEPPSRR